MVPVLLVLLAIGIGAAVYLMRRAPVKQAAVAGFRANGDVLPLVAELLWRQTRSPRVFAVLSAGKDDPGGRTLLLRHEAGEYLLDFPMFTESQRQTERRILEIAGELKVRNSIQPLGQGRKLLTLHVRDTPTGISATTLMLLAEVYGTTPEDDLYFRISDTSLE